LKTRKNPENNRENEIEEPPENHKNYMKRNESEKKSAYVYIAYFTKRYENP
jgi:hypothetical protein